MNDAEKLILENQIKILRKFDGMKVSLAQIVAGEPPMDGEFSSDRETTDSIANEVQNLINKN